MKWYLKIFILLFMCSSAGELFSQDRHEKVEVLRAEFISRRLELTAAEYEKFWPVYNEYNDKLHAVKKNLRQSYRRKSENMTDAGADELYQLELQSRQAEMDIHKQYGERIKGIIGAKKWVKLRLAEEDFKLTMIKTIRGE